MKLDSRILEGKKPLTCFDTEQAKQFLGKECYFSDHLCTFNELLDAYSYVTADMLVSKEKHLYVGELLTVSDSDGSCYEAGINGEAEWFQFCLPCEWVKEKKEPKYRPFTLAEWIDQHEIGDVIHYRSKSGEIELRQMYVGTRHSQGIKNIIVKITLGEVSHTLDYLFEDYEIEVNGEWLPFGVIDE